MFIYALAELVDGVTKLTGLRGAPNFSHGFVYYFNCKIDKKLRDRQLPRSLIDQSAFIIDKHLLNYELMGKGYRQNVCQRPAALTYLIIALTVSAVPSTKVTFTMTIC